MASQRSSGLVLRVVMIILLAFECSSAQCHQGNLGIQSQKDVLLQSDAKSLLGRKMLHKLDEKTVHPPQDVDSSNKKHEESKAFLEAADEVANLMRKDYHGTARRKPPINNHVPED